MKLSIRLANGKPVNNGVIFINETTYKIDWLIYLCSRGIN